MLVVLILAAVVAAVVIEAVVRKVFVLRKLEDACGRSPPTFWESSFCGSICKTLADICERLHRRAIRVMTQLQLWLDPPHGQLVREPWDSAARQAKHDGE